MNAQKKTLALILGTAMGASVAMSPVSAAENPFALKPLASGYMVADNADGGEKMKDGKCSTGKCSSSMKKKKAKAEEKAKEGNCSAEKAKEGNCSAEKKAAADKAKEGNCSANKAKEGNCSAEKK
jgi:uncharacterized low-complexity protein